MQLKEIVNVYLNVSEKLTSYFPSRKRSLNKLYLNLSELTQFLIFDNQKDKNFFYPGTKLYPKNLNSVLKIYTDLEKALENPNKMDKEELGELLYDLNTKLRSFQWYLSDARKSLKSILKEIDK